VTPQVTPQVTRLQCDSTLAQVTRLQCDSTLAQVTRLQCDSTLAQVLALTHDKTKSHRPRFACGGDGGGRLLLPCHSRLLLPYHSHLLLPYHLSRLHPMHVSAHSWRQMHHQHNSQQMCRLEKSDWVGEEVGKSEKKVDEGVARAAVG